MRSRFALAWMVSLFVGGCGLLIGLEDRELPADGSDSGADGTTPTDGSKIDTGSDGTVLTDGSPTDTGVDSPNDGGSDGDADADACACATGCNPEGACNDDIVSIGVGRVHQCLVRGDGKIFCMGGNQFHQLATNAVALSETWRSVVVMNGATEILFKEIGVGPLSNCAISREGDLYCWGSNAFLQLAQPGGGTIQAPTKVDLGALKVKAVSVGAQATCAITDAATGPNVRCWGHSSSGDLGVGYDVTEGGAPGPYSLSTPQTVKDIRAKAIHVLDSDDDRLGRACAISETGDLPFCWGGTPNSEITTALPGTSCEPVSGSPFACYLEPTAWGANASRDIGNGAKEVCALELADAGNTIRCRGSAGVNALDDSCGSPNAGFQITVPDGGGNPVRLGSSNGARCFVNETGDVWCFGTNGAFQAAREGSDKCVDAASIPPDRRPAEPLRITFFPDGGGASSGEGVPVKAKLIAVGRQGILVYTTDKKLVGWGSNMEGQLGARPSADAEAPSCFQVDGRCQGPTIIPPPAFP